MFSVFCFGERWGPGLSHEYQRHINVWILKRYRRAWECSQEGAVAAWSDEWAMDEWTRMCGKGAGQCVSEGNLWAKVCSTMTSEGPQILGEEKGPAGKEAGRVGGAGTCHTPGSGLCSNPPESCLTKWEKLAGTFPQPHLDMDGASSVSPISKYAVIFFSKPFRQSGWATQKTLGGFQCSFTLLVQEGKHSFIFYGTHGLGDFFYIIKNEILGENSKIWFHGFLQYYT